MTYINIDNKNIHYKQYGSGETVVFLNGMLMSTNSWSPFINTVSKKYNMITIDLLDQGKSDSSNMDYNIDTQVQILKKFLDKLGLKKVSLLGTSYGGKIALDFSIKYSNMVKSLILANTDSHTTDYMKNIAEQWAKAASTLDPSIFLNSTMPYMYSYSYYKENYEGLEELEKVFKKIMNIEWLERFKNALNSANGFNISHKLNTINVPTLIISSELDVITPTEYQELLFKEIKNSKWETIKDVGHASMYEKPEEFISIVMEFLN